MNQDHEIKALRLNLQYLDDYTRGLCTRLLDRLETAEADAARYLNLRDWLQRQGQLLCVDCQPGPGEPTGPYWVFRGCYMVKGGTPAGYGKTEDAAIDKAFAAMQAKEPQP